MSLSSTRCDLIDSLLRLYKSGLPILDITQYLTGVFGWQYNIRDSMSLDLRSVWNDSAEVVFKTSEFVDIILVIWYLPGSRDKLLENSIFKQIWEETNMIVLFNLNLGDDS